VTIGTQVWMVENLNVTHYRNGDPITNVTDNTQWFNLTTEAYCDYTGYGRIYNSYAVQDSRNIAPTGWHVPSDAEWTILSDYLINNGFGFDGSGHDIAKSMAATSGWDTFTDVGATGNNQASNNSSGFYSPSGWRSFHQWRFLRRRQVRLLVVFDGCLTNKYLEPGYRLQWQRFRPGATTIRMMAFSVALFERLIMTPISPWIQ